jgi:AcrR family transcriptional regulator
MEGKKQYRNAVRSRQMIRTAFMQLLEEKPFEKITATDIIQRADINRSTFYAHYPDARGIMDEIVGELTQMFSNMLSEIDFSVFFDDPMPILEKVTDFLQKNHELHQLLLRSSMALEQLEQLKRALSRQVLSAPNLPVENRDSLGTVIRVHMLLGGLIDTYRQWLLGEIPCSMDEAAREIAAIIRTMGKELK